MLMESAHDNANCASLLAAATKKSGTWLHAILNTALVLKLDDSALRIAVGLRLGTTVCVAHHQHCEEDENSQGTHALSCRKSEGRHHRLEAVNNIIKRAFHAAKIHSRLEPTGLSRSNGKRPDGATVMLWSHDQLLAWDATFPDTLVPCLEWTG